MNRILYLTLAVVMLFLFSSVSLAQDATAGTAPLDTITGDTASYYGQQVTTEGWLVEFVNSRVFVLGEGDPLFDSQVLVINNTNQELPLNVVTGERVQLTGVVLPSFEEGGFDQVISSLMTHMTMPQDTMQGTPAAEGETMTDPLAEATQASDPDTAVKATPTIAAGVVTESLPDTSVVDPTLNLDFTPLTDVVAERFFNYTIIELTSIDQISYIPTE